MSSQEAAPVKATQTSFTILEQMAGRDGVGVRELANELSMAKSTVHDHLRTLEELEYVVSDDNTYRIGLGLLDLGGNARQNMTVYQVAKPEIEDLAAETGEHANLMVEEHGRGVFLYKAEGEKALRLDTHIGMRIPLHTAALGKAIMAHQPREHVESILEKHGLKRITENTITDRQELYDELETIRQQGFAIDNGERVEGTRCLAAPILDSSGEAIAAVSVSGPKSRLHDDHLKTTIRNAVERTTNIIRVNINYI